MRILVLSLVLILAGCSGTKNPIVQVQGKIILPNGKPPPAGSKLIFNPSEGQMGTASGVTNADGSFALTHVNNVSGAEVGKYVVVVRPPDNDKTLYTVVSQSACEEGIFAEVKDGMQPLELRLPLAKKR